MGWVDILRKIPGMSERMVVKAVFTDGKRNYAEVAAGKAGTLRSEIGDAIAYMEAFVIQPTEGEGNIEYTVFSVFSVGAIDLARAGHSSLGQNPGGLNLATDILDSQQIV